MSNDLYESIELRFRRQSCLPPRYGTIMELIREIDSGEGYIGRIEQIIAGDPAFVAVLLRIYTAHNPGDHGYGGIRPLLMRLGTRSLRNIAISTLMHQILSDNESMPPALSARLVRSAVSNAFFSKYIFARRCRDTTYDPKFTADEIFTVGLLSRIGISMLAMAAPDVHGRVMAFARRTKVRYENAFETLVGNSLFGLAGTCCQAWGFPPVYEEVLAFVDQPWHSQEDFTAVCCVRHAMQLSHQAGWNFEEWDFEDPVTPDIELEVGLAEGEFDLIMPAIAGHVDNVLGVSADAANPSAA